MGEGRREISYVKVQKLELEFSNKKTKWLAAMRSDDEFNFYIF